MTSIIKERTEALVNSLIRSSDRIGIRVSTNLWAAWDYENGEGMQSN